MIKWNEVTWYSQVLAIILGLLIFASGYYLGKYQKNENLISDNQKNVPIEDTSEVVASTTVTFKGLEMVAKELPPLPSDEEWQATLNNTDIFRNRYEEDVKMYGDIAKRYHASDEYGYLYLEIVEVDINRDGKPEKIVGFDGGGTYGIERYEIVENEKVIATIESPSVGRGGAIKPDESGNGFTMIWYTNEMFPNGYCCPVARMVTKFVFEDGKFKPAGEEKENLSNE